MEEDFYIKLIYRELSGALEPGDSEQLATWLARSPENRAMAERIKKAWAFSGELGPELEVDLDSEFGELEKLLDVEAENQDTPKVHQLEPKRNPWPRYLSIAASILALIVAGTLMYPQLFKQKEGGKNWVVVESGDNPQRVELTDGTEVHLLQNSSLTYPESFSSDSRKVILKGEALFEVTHRPEQPFIVDLEKEAIQVLGTRFLVKEGAKESSVYVLEGKVKYELKAQKDSLILEKFDKGIANHDAQALEKLNDQRSGDLLWLAKRFEFKNTPFLEVIKIVESSYGVRLEYENKELENCNLIFDAEVDGFSELLSILETVWSVEVNTQDKISYLLAGGTCN